MRGECLTDRQRRWLVGLDEHGAWAPIIDDDLGIQEAEDIHDLLVRGLVIIRKSSMYVSKEWMITPSGSEAVVQRFGLDDAGPV